MLWQQLQDKITQRMSKFELDEALEISLQNTHRPVLYVDTEQQLLSCLTPSSTSAQNFPVSTSRFGIGQQQGSYQTPTGIHRIAEKIGAGEPPGRVFKARQATEQLCYPDDDASKQDRDEDVISSRILWLQGLEPGINKGEDVDSYQRYIYIHGTSDEAHIGKPASIGCIRLKNKDIIQLFDEIEVGDLVVIE